MSRLSGYARFIDALSFPRAGRDGLHYGKLRPIGASNV